MPNTASGLDTVISKASVLLEALPYLKAFRGRIFVIKSGGSALGDLEKRRQLLQDILFLSLAGIQPVLVHGGGPEISHHLKSRGHTPQFVEGLRVTDRATLKVVARTLRQVNRRLVSELRKLGAQAQGISGAQEGILKAERLKIQGKDIGFVGKVTQVDPRPIRNLLKEQKIPVVIPLAQGAHGQVYNINADQAGAALAGRLRAEKFVLITDVQGILKDPVHPKSLIPTVSVVQAEKLIAQGTIQQGMIPKTRACIQALRMGVHKTHMINITIPHGLLLEIFTDRGIGTEIVIR